MMTPIHSPVFSLASDQQQGPGNPTFSLDCAFGKNDPLLPLDRTKGEGERIVNTISRRLIHHKDMVISSNTFKIISENKGSLTWASSSSTLMFSRISDFKASANALPPFSSWKGLFG